MLGNGRLEAQCIDGTKRLCHIRGKMRKKVWVNTGDIVLVDGHLTLTHQARVRLVAKRDGDTN